MPLPDGKRLFPVRLPWRSLGSCFRPPKLLLSRVQKQRRSHHAGEVFFGGLFCFVFTAIRSQIGKPAKFVVGIEKPMPAYPGQLGVSFLSLLSWNKICYKPLVWNRIRFSTIQYVCAVMRKRDTCFLLLMYLLSDAVPLNSSMEESRRGFVETLINGDI